MEAPCTKPLSYLNELLIPFEANRLECASVIFFNSELNLTETADEVSEACAYIIPDNIVGLTAPDKKVFFAERYGGDGILRNGGGGRGGYDGKYSIKGIGTNKLVADCSDPSHADGKLRLLDAIYEAIWGEIINIALPYGATRTLAIILTSEKYLIDEELHNRALSVREPTVRPAHFMRALMYKEKKGSLFEKDFKRVEAAIKKLVDFLPYDEFKVDDAVSRNVRLSRGLTSLSKRYARQFAYARAKRIVHRTVSASNVAIEGGWLDLTRTTIFTDDLFKDKFDFDSFAMEFTPAVQSLRHISFYCYKYLGISKDDSSEIFRSAAYEFSKEYSLSLSIGLMAQAGFSVLFTSKLCETDQFSRMSTLLRKVMEQNGYGVREVKTSEGWEGFEFNVARTLKAMLSFCMGNNEKPGDSYDGQNPSHLDIYKVFFESVCALAITIGIAEKSLIRGMWISITKFTRTPKLLHQKYLDAAINDLSESLDKNTLKKEGVQEFINNVASSATLSLQYDESYDVVVWQSSSLKIIYSMPIDKFVLSSVAETKVLKFADLKVMSSNNPEIKSALSFYQDIWSLFL
ncbi:hypothetical protein [Pseudomonas sp. EA_15y_Pfl2_R67]|uniref:hypothetical protein n=1 Tax=Pseudomonas sp. EA_15y_Pfl2_R67 TaxID=3088687 RepID=UPI0030DA0954